MFYKLLKIIRSDEFRVQLAELNDNFFNLKQEIQIRNLLVELFNQKYKQENERAIAEYRVRNKKVSNKNIRIDLALVNKSSKEKILIEFKYHFPEDSQIKEESLRNYFEKRIECDYLISIICNGNEEIRKAYEEDWGIKTMFAERYSEETQWKELLEKQFSSLESEKKSLKPIEVTIKVDKPFETTYHFFILERKKEEK
ncbi:hypothetical protein SAMN05444420_103127 [Capnocytophaga granulosa]|uniref:Uncharacterized protein n=1 Tax=Capnocytophaga granulosa TaxID=45242 RepID=A0A1H2VB54_9FLAO|nr:hypothetical protein [Capnocytophaga granulosa]EPD28349.1 hypothetical protein HMPREF9331_01549 [Capnocytophaga granulosa ATCC 51502]SDW65576.1 hypothetical protein SAMN05444420_103127 [Capnocytophaga granulosa]SUX17761.1 Uncharacterised protein [Capnocytophaga granulosa]